jgi:hypothetical protein
MNVSKLDLAWESINALGGTIKAGDEYGLGYSHAIDRALQAIEKLGGADPAPKRVKRPVHCTDPGCDCGGAS